MSGATRKISKNLDRISKSASESMTKINAASNGAISGLRNVATAATATAVAVGAIAVGLGGAGMDFEQAITDVGAVSLMTREQVSDLEKEALKLGATTKFSATQVANGMELMGKAGFDNQQILEGIGGVLAAAAADGGDLAETAGHVSNVLKGMGLATTETTRVADVLALASARTNSSIGSLGESMSKVSSTARQFNIPMEDVVSAVAMLQDVGLDASEAGSAVNTMLTQMAAPTDKAKASMKALGVSFQDSKGNMLPFADVLGQLKKSAEKSGGNMKQVAFFAELVGLRGQKAAGNLKDLFTSGKFQSLKEELDHAAGSAKKMADIKMDTFKGDIETLGGAVDSLKIALFDTQGGALRGIVKGMTEWVDANNGFITSGFVELVERGVPIVTAFADGLKNGFNDMIPAIKLTAGAFKLLLTPFMWLFGPGASAGPLVAASEWGETIGQIAVAVAIFAVVTKAAAAGMFIYSAMTKTAAFATAIWTGITRAANAALVIYNLTKQFGIGYLWAMITGTQMETGAKVTNTTATGFNTAATRIATAAKGFFAISTGGATTALMAQTGILSASTAGFIALGLAMVAVVGAYMLLNSQLEDFKKSNDGIGFGEFMGEYATNDKGMFETMDGMMNAKAKQRKKDADALAANGGVPPNGTAAPGMPTNVEDLTKQMEALNTTLAASQGAASTMPGIPGVDPASMPALDGASMAALENLQVTGPAEIVLPDRLARDDRMTITVRSEGGAEAEVTEGPTTKGTTIKLESSGDF